MPSGSVRQLVSTAPSSHSWGCSGSWVPSGVLLWVSGVDGRLESVPAGKLVSSTAELVRGALEEFAAGLEGRGGAELPWLAAGSCASEHAGSVTQARSKVQIENGVRVVAMDIKGRRGRWRP